MKPPKWYWRDEIKEWFIRRGIEHSPKEIVMFTEELQKAFNKGFEKGIAVSTKNNQLNALEPKPCSEFKHETCIIKGIETCPLCNKSLVK